jgi:HK97 family phage prohead protease
MIEYTAAVETEFKAIDHGARTLEAYASVFNVVDRQGDVVLPGAFSASLAGKKPADILAYLAHRTDRLPVGRPLAIAEDPFGLRVTTRVFRSQAGDDLLATAKELMEAGGSLGLSIGYRTVDHEWGHSDGGMPIRRLKAVDLREYSFLGSPALAANPYATVTAVKQTPRTMDEYRAELKALGDWLSASELEARRAARAEVERYAYALDQLDDRPRRVKDEEEARRKIGRLYELIDRYGFDKYDELRKIVFD